MSLYCSEFYSFFHLPPFPKQYASKAYGQLKSKEEYYLLGGYGMWSCRSLPMFRWKAPSPSSRSNSQASSRVSRVTFYHTIWHNIPEYSTLYSHCSENIRSDKLKSPACSHSTRHRKWKTYMYNCASCSNIQTLGTWKAESILVWSYSMERFWCQLTHSLIFFRNIIITLLIYKNWFDCIQSIHLLRSHSCSNNT
jgi:hypothetical protein